MRRSFFSLALTLTFLIASTSISNALELTNAPIEITADEAIEWQQNSKKLIAKGNAEAIKGKLKLNSDTITATYKDSPDDSKKIDRITAKGNVKIFSEGNKAVGSFAEYNISKQWVRITGKPAKLIRNNGKETISANIIKAYLKKTDKKKDNQNPIKAIEAIGNVVVINGEEKITSTRGVYNPRTEMVELFGPITIEQGQNTLKGSYATVNLKTGISKMFANKPSSNDKTPPTPKGRVKGFFVPTKK
ncbi:MAG: hypothetical protein GY804_13195 [Alphaproteobacteria bacterium]|nr:hypothetical protein [Alphaproteobacteria bacterium]